MKKEDYFSSKMLIKSSAKKLDKDQSFSGEAETKMNEIVEELENRMKSL